MIDKKVEALSETDWVAAAAKPVIPIDYEAGSALEEAEEVPEDAFQVIVKAPNPNESMGG